LLEELAFLHADHLQQLRVEPQQQRQAAQRPVAVDAQHRAELLAGLYLGRYLPGQRRLGGERRRGRRGRLRERQGVRQEHRRERHDLHGWTVTFHRKSTPCLNRLGATWNPERTVTVSLVFAVSPEFTA